MKPAIEHVIEAPAVPSKASRVTVRVMLTVAALLVVALLTWQGLTAHGSPNPEAPGTTRASAIIDIGVLVFREGLESILVLSAILANMSGDKKTFRHPVSTGIGLGMFATVVTWFVAVGILSDLTTNVSALNLQAGTGLLAIIVLMVVMNWFFHKIYWGGWISLHNRKKKDLITEAREADGLRAKMWWGLCLVGFSSFYREGFEVVLFLQSYRLRLGTAMVMAGLAVGLFFTGIVAVLNFVAHRKLPYRKMLILTGIMLGAVLLVMVGEQVQEMQQANWLHTTDIAWLSPHVPDWVGVWFGFFPNVETVIGQGLAFLIVVGSYVLYRRMSRKGEVEELAN
jgi:high-affinity iron transporter